MLTLAVVCVSVCVSVVCGGGGGVVCVYGGVYVCVNAVCLLFAGFILLLHELALVSAARARRCRVAATAPKPATRAFSLLELRTSLPAMRPSPPFSLAPRTRCVSVHAAFVFVFCGGVAGTLHVAACCLC